VSAALAAGAIAVADPGGRARTSRAMAVSTVVHAALIAALLVMHPPVPPTPDWTEISWLSPGEATPEPAAGGGAPAPAIKPQAGAAHSGTVEQRFTRPTPHADLAPAPQSAEALEDRVAARLASLQQTPRAAAPLGLGPDMSGSAAGVPAGTGAGPALALRRGGGGGGTTPLPLARGGGGGSLPAAATAPAATARAADRIARGAATAHAGLPEGAAIMGPIADRPILRYAKPAYPEWAKEQGVEGSVTLSFVVRPDGAVREDIVVQTTAGFEDFDDSARAALKMWRFAPLGGGAGDQWGTITFHFRLHGAESR
jgi:TonB family protein